MKVSSDQRIVHHFVKLLKDFGCKVLVGDSSGGAYPRRAGVFEATGMLDVIRSSSADFVELEKIPPIKMDLMKEF